MAKYDSADLLRRARFEARRPAIDMAFGKETWYDFLSQAQEHWYDVFASLIPASLYGAPVLLTTADGGETYTFGLDADGNAISPIGAVEVRATRSGDLLNPGAEFDDSCDFTIEGTKIRIPGGRKRTFSSGPYARFITPPTVIDDETEPTLQPLRARKLLVFRAVALWAEGPGMRDPEPFYSKEGRLWRGNPEQGDYGLLGSLRNQFLNQGLEGTRQDAGEAWWRGIQQSPGY